MTREPNTLTPEELVRRLRLGARAVELTGDAPILWSGESRQTLVGLLNAAADALELVGVPVVARDEARELRQVISECAAALGTGASVAPTASIEFMKELPREIRLAMKQARDEAAELRAAIKAWAKALDAESGAQSAAYAAAQHEQGYEASYDAWRAAQDRLGEAEERLYALAATEGQP